MTRRIGALLLVLAGMRCLTAAASGLTEDEVRRTLARAPDLQQGQQLFATCAGCHGPDGAGRAESWIPRIGGQRYEVIVRQLIDYRHGRRWDERMQANTAEHRLTDLQSVSSVAGYAAQLSPPRPAPRDPAPYVARGRQVYAAQCARCHGAHGEGQGDAPRLASQHASYLVRQVHDMVEGRRPNVAQAHVRLLERLDYQDIEGFADAMSQEE